MASGANVSHSPSTTVESSMKSTEVRLDSSVMHTKDVQTDKLASFQHVVSVSENDVSRSDYGRTSVHTSSSRDTASFDKFPPKSSIVGFGPCSGSSRITTNQNNVSPGMGSTGLTHTKDSPRGLLSSLVGSLFSNTLTSSSTTHTQPAHNTHHGGHAHAHTTRVGDISHGANQSSFQNTNFRPKGLPPKDPDEMEKQRKEVEKIHALLIQREMDMAKQMEEREQTIMSNVIKWKTVLLPEWLSKRGSKQVRDATYQGIPPMVRERAWYVALGNELQITKDLYEIFQLSAQQKRKQRRNITDGLGTSVNLARPDETISSSRRDSDSSGDSINDNADPSMSTYDVNTHKIERSVNYVGREASATLIELDLGRTFPALDFFRVGGPFHDTLRTILETYVSYRPDIGYVQGMSFIASVLLLYMSELEAFTCFANILNRPILMTFFRMDLAGIEPCIRTFNNLLQEHVPSVFVHLSTLGLHCDMFLIDWFLTIFSKSLHIDVATRVWDIFLVVGDVVMWRTSVAIFKLYEKKITELDFEGTAYFVTHIPCDMSVEKLMKNIRGLESTITDKKVDALLKRNGFVPTRTLP